MFYTKDFLNFLKECRYGVMGLAAIVETIGRYNLEA